MKIKKITKDTKRPSPYELGTMCKLVYKENFSDDDLPTNLKGWSILKISELNDSAYFGVAYFHKERKQIVIAHRGTVTELTKNLFCDDLAIALKKTPPSNEEARKFSKDIRIIEFSKEYFYTETGHSLGAVHAELNTYYFDDCLCVSFDSPGSKEMLLEQSKNGRKINEDNFKVYLSNPHLINTANSHVGQRIRVYVSHSMLSKTSDDLEFISSIFSVESFIGLLIKKSTKLAQNYITSLLSLQLQQHSIENIMSGFDSEIGEPFLQRHIDSWPTNDDLLKLWISNLFSDFFKEKNYIINKPVVANNKWHESKLDKIDSYKVSDLYFPNFPSEVLLLKEKAFVLQSIRKYDTYYENSENRKKIECLFVESILKEEINFENLDINYKNSFLFFNQQTQYEKCETISFDKANKLFSEELDDFNNN